MKKIVLLLLLLTTAHSYAELPFQIDDQQTMIVTIGKHWFNTASKSNDFILTADFAPQKEFLFGFSYRSHSYEYDYNHYNNGSYSISERIKSSYTFTNYHLLLYPFQIAKIKPKISIAVYGAYQIFHSYTNFQTAIHFYKKFNLNNTRYVQPVITIGHRDPSSVSNKNKISLSASVIYKTTIANELQFLIIPKVNHINDRTGFSLNIGIAQSLKRQ